jgi:hypothetical protein
VVPVSLLLLRWLPAKVCAWLLLGLVLFVVGSGLRQDHPDWFQGVLFAKPAPARPAPKHPAPPRRAAPVPARGRAARADVPARYLTLYQHASGTCPRLSWALLAAVGKVESDHGRSPAPGVRSGVNRAGCCAGPMQFNVRNGPPSTWAAWRRPGDSVYDPADAIPAAARKLCAGGLAGPPPPDPCPRLAGSARVQAAVHAYNHACWYVGRVQAQAAVYQGAQR